MSYEHHGDVTDVGTDDGSDHMSLYLHVDGEAHAFHLSEEMTMRLLVEVASRSSKCGHNRPWSFKWEDELDTIMRLRAVFVPEEKKT